MSDQGSIGGDIWLVPANGKGEPTDITPGSDGTPTWMTWVNDHELGFVEHRRGHTRLVDWDPAKKKDDPSQPTSERSPSRAAPSRMQSPIRTMTSIAFVERSHTAGAEIWAGQR